MLEYEKEIKDILSSLNILDEYIKLELPKSLNLGDIAFPCFVLSKVIKKSPDEIAKDICFKINNNKKFKESLFEKVEHIGPYINFFIKKEIKSEKVISSILDGSFFKFEKKKETVMVEYCQVNTHKAFHIGHLRGTLIGSSLVNLLKKYGYNVISANYQGDTGAHVAKSLWYLINYSKESFPEKRKGIWLGQIYQKANQLLKDEKNREQYKNEISAVLQKLESRDKEITDLWKKTRQYSLDDFEEIYSLLGVKFDEYFFEGDMEKKGKEIVNELLNKKIAYYDDEAVVIDLKKYNLGIFILLKSDGTTLYSTKDIALAKIKFEEFNVHKALYVVGSEQKYYFQQLFKTLEIMGFKQSENCKHISFDLINLEGGKISSREGELILALDLIEEITKTAINEVKKRNNVENIEETGNAIAISALKFGFLNYDNNKSIIFNMNKSLDFEGETGPYIQYACARISSIFYKAQLKKTDINKFKIDYSKFNENIENEIISKLMEYNFVIHNCASNYKINPLSRYLIELSQLFNEYYHKCSILKEEESLKNARLVLIYCVQKVLSEGLSILGISTIEKM